MQPITRIIGAAMLALAASGLQAEDFNPLMQVTRATWPEKNHIGVICDYRASRADVEALALAAGPGAFITVADTRASDLAGRAATLLAAHRADFLVLMPNDRFFRDGAYGATLAIGRLGSRGVPALGTTPEALRQGAVFSIGDGTRGELLVTGKLIGTVDVILPPRAFYERQVGRAPGGAATITVLATP